MERPSRRAVSGLRSVLDRRIIEEFAPIVGELLATSEATTDQVQVFLEELERQDEAQRIIFDVDGDEAP